MTRSIKHQINGINEKEQTFSCAASTIFHAFLISSRRSIIFTWSSSDNFRVEDTFFAMGHMMRDKSCSGLSKTILFEFVVAICTFDTRRVREVARTILNNFVHQVLDRTN